ncbi:hypothetical protein L6164_007767 [Bauhinia variegata]|uniref:Uncharacterized protein n=1 Tax=Bauhinia variegata TaxID=167791 RepID=A0ACB9PDJ4_BAUVA|nr:hypothetical protein L6164_007767 [Bauhinia variegata]
MASYCHSHPFTFPLIPLSYMIILLISLKSIPRVNSIDSFPSCSKQFNCGNLTNVGFPFWGGGRAEGCGYPEFYLNCTENLPYITFNNITYLVKEVHPQNHTLKIAFKELCPAPFPSNTTDILDGNLFDYVSGYQNLTLLYGCNETVAKGRKGYFECPIHGVADRYAYPVLGNWDSSPWHCTYGLVARVRSTFTVSEFANFQAKMKDGFEVKWLVGVDCDQCQRFGGVCGYNLKSKQTTCNYADAKSPQGMSKILQQVVIAIFI